METSRSLVRQLNRKRVLQQVFNHSEISRSQISKNLNLNKVTVSDIVAELLTQDYLVELGKGAASTRGGRRPTMLKFNRDYGVILSVDLGYDYVESMLCRANGEQVQTIHQETAEMSIEKRLTVLHDTAEELLKQYQTLNGLLGISVAIHGVVADNKVLYTPYIDFAGLDIAQIISSEFQVPVWLQNEANLSVIYERDFESRQSVDNLVCISIHKGIGAGIILNNTLYNGIHGEAGEIGHSVVYQTDLVDGKPHEAIEAYCSEDAVIKKVKVATTNNGITRQDIKTLYRQHDSRVVPIMDDFCFYMAGIIHNIMMTLDPAQVIINSNLVAEIPELLTKIQANIPYLTNDKTPVYLSKNSKYAILLGGASSVINQVLEMQPGELFFGTKTMS